MILVILFIFYATWLWQSCYKDNEKANQIKHKEHPRVLASNTVPLHHLSISLRIITAEFDRSIAFA